MNNYKNTNLFTNEGFEIPKPIHHYTVGNQLNVFFEDSSFPILWITFIDNYYIKKFIKDDVPKEAVVIEYTDESLNNHGWQFSLGYSNMYFDPRDGGKANVFDSRELAEWYQSHMIPDIIGTVIRPINEVDTGGKAWRNGAYYIREFPEKGEKKYHDELINQRENISIVINNLEKKMKERNNDSI